MRRDRLQRLVIAMLVLAGMPRASFTQAPAPGQTGNYWPGFRGPGAAGVSVSDERLPVTFSPDAPSMAWKIDLPEGHSSPVVWGNYIFLTGVHRPSKRLEVISVDRKAGRIVWRREMTVETFETSHAVGNPATATPTTDGERVYAYFGSTGVVAFDFKGNEVWKVPLPPAQMPYGSGTSPVLAGDLLLLSREGPEKYLLAVDKRSGKPVWKHEHGSHGCIGSHSTPVVWKDQIVLNRCGEIVGLDRQTGARRWWLAVGSGSGDSTPVVTDDLIYASSWNNFGEPDLRRALPTFEEAKLAWDKDGDGVLSQTEFPANGVSISSRIDAGTTPGADWRLAFPAFDANRNGSVGPVEWEVMVGGVKRAEVDHGLFAIRPNGQGALPAGSVIWRETRGVAEVPSPLFYRNKVYMVTNGGTVSTMNAASGALVYRARLGAPGLYFSSPVASGGRIYIASGDGVLSVISDADALEVLARNAIGEPMFATPALADGHIYVRTASHLYGFREP